MGPYLIDSGEYPFSADDLRADLGIPETRRFDALIESEISHVCIAASGAGHPIRRETWLVDADNVAALGEPVKVGPVEYWNGHAMRRCVYGPSTDKLAAARRKIVAAMLRHDDYDIYMARNHPQTLAAIRAGTFAATPVLEVA